MKIANVDGDSLFWTTWGISMKFSGKMTICQYVSYGNIKSHKLDRQCNYFNKPKIENGKTEDRGVSKTSANI